MAVQQVVICNNCGTQKKDTNHWFVYDIVNDYPPHDIAHIEFLPMPKEAYEEFTGHVCGVPCAVAVLSRELEKLGKEDSKGTDHP